MIVTPGNITRVSRPLVSLCRAAYSFVFPPSCPLCHQELESASLSIDGKLKDAEVVGTKKFALKPGQYMLKLVHPKRTVTTPVNITANKAVTVPFRAFEPQ